MPTGIKTFFSFLARFGGWFAVRGISIGHINKVKPRRARLVLGLVTFGGSTIPKFLQPIRPTQPGNPCLGRCNEYKPSPGKKRRVLRSSGPCNTQRTYWLIACWLNWLAAQKSKGMSSLATNLTVYE